MHLIKLESKVDTCNECVSCDTEWDTTYCDNIESIWYQCTREDDITVCDKKQGKMLVHIVKDGKTLCGMAGEGEPVKGKVSCLECLTELGVNVEVRRKL